MIKLKICGMKEAANIASAAELRPDYMGFIFYKGSPRYVGDDFELDRKYGVIDNVGVFVDETTDEISRVLKQLRSGIAQLHGNETVEQCAELRATGVQVIKVFRVDDSFDFNDTVPFEKVADYFLFDTRGKSYGGNAITFNWEKLKEYNQSVPFFLSGGLNANNINDLSQFEGMNLYALDLNSGVEDEPGLKNINKIKEVITTIR